MIRFIRGLIDTIYMAFVFAFDKELISEAQAEQAVEEYERNNKIGPYAEHK